MSAIHGLNKAAPARGPAPAASGVTKKGSSVLSRRQPYFASDAQQHLQECLDEMEMLVRD